MVKKPKNVASDTINVALLQNIAAATAENKTVYLNKAEGEPLLLKSLIDTNMGIVDPSDPTRVASRITQTGMEYLKAMNNGQAGSIENNPINEKSAGMFDIISNAVLPSSKRGNKGGGAPTIYPFDKMEIGQSFFVPKSDKHKDPVKTLGSTVSAANMRFAEETGEIERVERTKRGERNKAILDENGKKVKEMVERKKYKLTRKFSLRSVKAGEKYGEWTAPADGALIARVAI